MDILEAIKNALVATPGWAIGGFAGGCVTASLFVIKWIYNKYKNWKTSEDLVEYQYEPQNVKAKRELYIETKAQNLPPSVEDELSTSSDFIVRKELIPFFIKSAFRKKEKDKFYLVLGDSGMGKTTFMINLYLRYSSFFNLGRLYSIRLLPFSDKDVLEKIKAIKQKEDVSKTILLLDAFDEYHQLLPPDISDGLSDDERFRKVLHEVIEAVQDFREVVLTSRTQYFPSQEDKPYKLEINRPDDDGVHELVKLYLSPFDDRDVTRYLKKRYGRVRFWNLRKKRVAEEVVGRSHKLMVRPMLLSNIDLFVDGKAEYKNSWQIYERLVEGWIEREGKKREHQNRETEEFKQKLREYSQLVALRIYEKRKEVSGFCLLRSEATDIESGLKDYQVTGHSLLTRDGGNNWKFAHKSILEFFLAKKALENPDFAMKLDFFGMDMVKQFCDENGALLLRNFVLIKGGEFTMGSPSGEVDRRDDETQHQVKLSDFNLCKYSVTVDEFRKFISESRYQTDAERTNSSVIFDGKTWKNRKGVNWRHGVSGSVRPQSEDNHPVVHVSWNDAVAYCEWLSKKTGKTFRLPTEAEWEYACRAGTTTPFGTGENLTTEQANYDGNFPYNNNPNGEYREITVAVDSFKPNAWGLYNMHGNVYEWCGDWYGDKYYEECKAKGIVENPEGPKKGSYRVLRGGSWGSGARLCRSADRTLTPDFRLIVVGFRLAFTP